VCCPKRNKKLREITLAEFGTAGSLHGGVQMELDVIYSTGCSKKSYPPVV
jgi:hypothetical protein